MAFHYQFSTVLLAQERILDRGEWDSSICGKSVNKMINDEFQNLFKTNACNSSSVTSIEIIIEKKL